MVDRWCRALPDGVHGCGRVAAEVVGGVVPLCTEHAAAVRAGVSSARPASSSSRSGKAAR